MLDELKALLGFAPDDTGNDERLYIILNLTRKRLRNKLGGTEPPEELEHIIVEVAVKRFNRIGSEGMNSHTVEGESYSFSDDDFAEYENEIQAWLNSQESSSIGKVRFI